MKRSGSRTPLALMLVVCSLSCDRAGTSVGEVTDEAREFCVVALVGDEAVTTEHVRAIRSFLQPAPSPPAAERLAVDAALAVRRGQNRLQEIPPRDWLVAYWGLYRENGPASRSPLCQRS